MANLVGADELVTDLTKPKKERKKKHLPHVRNEIVPIKCADKVGVERWTPDRLDIGNFPSPARILLIGECGVGKSTLIKNLIIHARPRFEEVYLVHEDAEYTKEYDDLEPTEKFNDVPPLEFWNYEGPHKKRAIIFDDVEMTTANRERLKNLAIAFRYASTHKGLTIYFAHQSFFNIMPLIKRMADVIIVWKVKARNELGLIENRVGLPDGTLRELFKNVATKHKDSICIDLKENSPAPLRLNVWQEIEIAPDD